MRLNDYILEFYKATGRIPKIGSFQFEDPLKTIFRLSPERALEFIKRRGRRLKITFNWREMDEKAHNRAFTVAKVMTADLLQTIYNYIEEAKKEGWTLEEFKRQIKPKIEQAGWTGATPSRLKVIYDTNMQMSYSQGKYQQQMLIAERYPYWRYTQIERPTKRHDHSIFHNKVFRYDDPIWDYIYPPSGFGCKCTVTPLKEADNVEDGRKYLDFVKKSKQFQLRPLKAWKVDTSKYVSKISKQLKLMLKQNKKR